MAHVITKKICRICGGSKLTRVLDLGAMPPANAFLTKSQLRKKQDNFPLAIYFCQDCTLLQLIDVVDPEILFKDYLYQTSASSPLLIHFKKLAQEILEKHIASKNDLVVEIGSNDGSLLEHFKNRARILGVDPAETMVTIAGAKGVPTLSAFFNEETARKIIDSHGHAKIILANNVLAHIDDLHSVFAGIETLLDADGKFIFEAHWVGNLLGKGGFDQIYHEHLCYFSLHAVNHLAKKFGLKVLDVVLVPIHGESLRVTLGKVGTPNARVSAFMKKEKKLGLEKFATYQKFSQKVAKNKIKLLALLKKLKQEDKKILGYGAPAKGNTLLNFLKLDQNTLDFITDTTASKQGLYAPGTRIPIIAPENLTSAKPDYILLLAWNYADEILKKETALRKSGVKFIIPVPEVKVV
ncbi:MAG: class I SAM-dependent methyltransferase [Patescibacteria group bacterium]